MKRLKLTNTNKIGLVDDDIFKKISGFSWGIGGRGGYVRRYVRVESNDTHKYIAVYLHQIVMGRKEGFILDHINGDKLDNRRENLRFCTHAQNLRNKPPTRSNATGFKGVSFNTRDNRYRADIIYEYKKKGLGNFKTAIEAARAYNKKAKELFGEFAWLNPV